MSTIDDSQAANYTSAFQTGAERFVASHPEETYHITGSLAQDGLRITEWKAKQ